MSGGCYWFTTEHDIGWFHQGPGLNGCIRFNVLYVLKNWCLNDVIVIILLFNKSGGHNTLSKLNCVALFMIFNVFVFMFGSLSPLCPIGSCQIFGIAQFY